MNNKRHFEVLETKENNKTLKINGVLLHSKYSPVNEAKAFLNKNVQIYEGKKNIVVYGIGLGYHISELLNRINIDSRVYIFDVDDEIVKFALEIGVLKRILDDSRVTIYKGNSENFFNSFANKMKLVEDILIFKPSLNTLPDRFNILKEIIKGYELGKIAVERFKDEMDKNEFLNQSIQHYLIDDFFQHYKFQAETIIIVSAGPSLDDSIEYLKRIKGNIKIFAVGSSLKPLMKNGIKPDMICIIDCQEIVYEQIRGHENLDIPLCYLSTASNLTVSSYNGPKYLFYNYSVKDNIIIDTGKSVATAILSIAIKGKASRVIFVGQDLAFIDNKDHSSHYVYGNEVHGNGALKKVLGVNGKVLDTTDGLLYFKFWIEETIKQNKQITFINASKGAKIKGTIEKELIDIVKE